MLNDMKLRKEVATSDDLWVKVDEDRWWFTKGISLYPKSMVDLWMKRHPGLVLVVTYFYS